MKPIEKSKKTSIIIAVLILIAALIGTGVFYSSNKSLAKNLNEEKLRTEMMLSEKLAIQKENESYKIRIDSLSDHKLKIDILLKLVNNELKEKNAQMNKMVHENIMAMNKQVAELERMKMDFESQTLTLNDAIKKMNIEKDQLNRTIASLQDQNKKLTANLDILTSMATDNFLIETTKKVWLQPNKEKLTVIARHAKKMTVSFNVPENMVENISFKLLKPNGTLVEGKDNGIASRIVNGDEGITASISGGAIKVSKKIEMIYTPEEKQKPGIYKIEMYNGEKYIGACNVKLR